MAEEDKKNLKKAINDLPIYHAPQDSWERLAKELEEENLQKAIKELPSLSLSAENSDVLFDNILEKASAEKTLNRWYWPKSYRIAAVVSLFVLAIGALFITNRMQNQANVKLTYSQEVIDKPKLIPASITSLEESKEDLLQFIDQHCREWVVHCQQPTFVLMLEQYQQLQETRLQLQLELEGNPEQHQLIRYLTEVEKEQTLIGKELIQQLIKV